MRDREAAVNHVLFSEFADQRITALKAEAAAVRLARSARGSEEAPGRRHKRHRPAVLSALVQR